MSTQRTSTRMPEKMSTSRTELDDLLAAQSVGHVGLVDGDTPVVLPTLVARRGDDLLIHGSTGSHWMRRLADGRPACVTVTEIGGIVVARSAFESSMIYRSAMIFGAFTVVGSDKQEALDVLTDRVIPGRADEVRPSTAKELAATLVLAMPIRTWTLRISDDWPDDPPSDVAGPSWAGQIRFGRTPATALPAPDLDARIVLPTSVHDLVD